MSKSEDRLSTEFKAKVTASSGSGRNARGNARISKSESPQSSSHLISGTDKNQASKMTKDSGHHSSSVSPLESPALTQESDSKVEFTFGSDESDAEQSGRTQSSASYTEASHSRHSASGGEKSPAATTKERENRRGRFKKMLRPLRRSQSAGCSKDVPAHALFLRQDTADHKPKEADRRTEPRRSLGRASLERQSSGDSESDDGSDKKGRGKKKSFTQDVKDKLAFLRRRHTDTALASKYNDRKGGRPSLDTILSWSKLFDTLLHDKYGLELFREFLRSEFSDENIEFWISCEEYKHIKSNKLMTQEAQRIYQDYVAIQAPHEINLDSKTRMDCRDKMGHPDKRTFEQAQKRIQALMAKDSYPRFLRSEFYQELIGDHKLKLKT